MCQEESIRDLLNYERGARPCSGFFLNKHSAESKKPGFMVNYKPLNKALWSITYPLLIKVQYCRKSKVNPSSISSIQNQGSSKMGITIEDHHIIT